MGVPGMLRFWDSRNTQGENGSETRAGAFPACLQPPSPVVIQIKTTKNPQFGWNPRQFSIEPAEWASQSETIFHVVTSVTANRSIRACDCKHLTDHRVPQESGSGSCTSRKFLIAVSLPGQSRTLRASHHAVSTASSED